MKYNCVNGKREIKKRSNKSFIQTIETMIDIIFSFSYANCASGDNCLCTRNFVLKAWVLNQAVRFSSIFLSTQFKVFYVPSTEPCLFLRTSFRRLKFKAPGSNLQWHSLCQRAISELWYILNSFGNYHYVS